MNNNETCETCETCGAAEVVQLFIAECGMMADENWCKSQTDMLHRLFTAVLMGEPYDSEEVTNKINEWRKS